MQPRKTCKTIYTNYQLGSARIVLKIVIILKSLVLYLIGSRIKINEIKILVIICCEEGISLGCMYKEPNLTRQVSDR